MHLGVKWVAEKFWFLRSLVMAKGLFYGQVTLFIRILLGAENPLDFSFRTVRLPRGMGDRLGADISLGRPPMVPNLWIRMGKKECYALRKQ